MNLNWTTHFAQKFKKWDPCGVLVIGLVISSMSFNHLYLLVILLAALCDAQANIESVSHHDLPSHRLWTAQYQPQNQKFHEYLLPLTEKQIVNHRMTKHFKLTKYSDLPEAYDVHTLFANKCKQSFTILSQGSCGSCWAFGMLIIFYIDI